MKSFRIIFLIVFSSYFVKAQDSTKAINQEIGFNTVLLVKQLFSNNPSSTLAQLPYVVFYNLYFKDKIGIRVGLGLSNSKTKTSIDSQSLPRETTQNALNLRVGVSNNFIKYHRLTLNAFVDGLFESTKFNTINTQTLQSGQSSTVTINTTSTDNVTGFGAQIGIGVKYNLYKHLSVYVEVPLSFLSESVSSTVTTITTGLPFQTSSSKSTNTSTRITAPTTLYLVLRF